VDGAACSVIVMVRFFAGEKERKKRKENLLSKHQPYFLTLLFLLYIACYDKFLFFSPDFISVCKGAARAPDLMQGVTQ
jgi:hypothetical protein